nr:hypothetical protein [Paenibacillus xylanexedens]
MKELKEKMLMWRSELERQGGTMGIESMVHTIMADYGEIYRENVRLRNELDKSKRDKDVMSNYLNELMHNTSNMVVASQIYNVLREAVGRDDYNPVDQKGESEHE